MRCLFLAAAFAPALALAPACVLACANQVSQAYDACGNKLNNIACIYKNLNNEMDACIETKCASASAAKASFSAIASVM